MNSAVQAAHPGYGAYPWDSVEVGDRIEVSSTYYSVVAELRKRVPGTNWASTTKGAPEGKRIVTRLA